MLGASSAGRLDLPLQGFAGAVYPDGGISRGNAGLGGQVFQTSLPQIDGFERRSVLGLEGFQQTVEAATDFALGGVFGGCGGIQVFGPGIKQASFGCLVAVMIDDGVAQYAVEPGYRAFIVPEGVAALQAADEGGLQEVFGGGGVVYAFAEEGQELLPAVEQAAEGFGSH